jgi:hypothetical protein
MFWADNAEHLAFLTMELLARICGRTRERARCSPGKQMPIGPTFPPACSLLMGATQNDGVPLDLLSAGEPPWLDAQFNRSGR